MWMYVLLLVTLPLLEAAASHHKLVKKQFVDGDSNDAFQFPDQTGDVETNTYQAGNYISSFMDPGGGGGGGGMNDDMADFAGLGTNPLEDSNGGSRQMLESPLNEGGNDLSSLSSLLTQDSNNEEAPTTSLTADTSSNPSSIFSNFNDNLNGGDDILSSLTDDPYGKKVESSVNLGDTSATSNSDLSSIDAFKGSSPFDKLLSNGYSVGLPPENGQNIGQATTTTETNKHKTGDSKEGIGNKLGDVQDLLSKELGQLDSADQKLENMLENGFDSDSNAFSNSDGASMDPYTMQNNQGGMMNVGTSTNWGMGGMDGSYYNGMQTSMNNQYNADSAAMSNMNGGDQQQQQNANQMTNPSNALADISHTVVHQHASDKQTGAKAGNDHLSLSASQNAANVQMHQKETHKVRLIKLKARLKLLDQKIEELTAEQSKKSYSNDGLDPRKQRNNAIKRLLIKNLKLAALIATKEIQIEEAKSRTLPNSSERKEDFLNGTDSSSSDKDNNISNDHDFLNDSKPLTELSRKAEEEVNHLTKNELNNAKHELLKHHNKTAETNSTLATVNGKVPSNMTAPANDVVKINETLEILDKTGNTIKNESFNALLPMKQNVTSINVTAENSMITSLPTTNSTVSATKTAGSSTDENVAVVGDLGMASLYNAMKEKAAANSAKRRSTLHKKMKKFTRKQILKFGRNRNKQHK